MRILHVTRTLDPAAGGLPMVVVRLAAAQAALGHDVSIGSHPPATDGSAADVARSVAAVPGFDRVARHPVAPAAGLLALLPRRTRASLDALAAGLDMLHLHGVWDPILRAAAGVARARRIPYAVAPHGMLDRWSLREKRFKKRLALALGYRRMLDNAAFLHTLNPDEADAIGDLRLRCPVEVIPNGVFLEEIDPLPAPGQFRARHPAALGDRPYVLFLSRLHYKKGLDHLADAFAIVARARPDVHLVVAGPDDGARADLERRIDAASLRPRVHIVGPIYGREKYEAIVDSAVFCLPSRQEGFSLAITEALACARPVVISRACNFPEVATSGAGLIVDLQPPAIADALTTVLASPDAAARMGAAGRALVVERFTWPAIARRSLDAYARHGAT